MSTARNCYCGSGLSYLNCCQPLHSGAQQALTAEQLMRSRYSAYCTGDYDYLAASHHPSTRGGDEYQPPLQPLDWAYLEILACHRGKAGDERGQVEFIAWYLNPNGELQPLHERSRFVRVDRQWLYLDGVTPPGLNRSQPNPGRNAPCWCGSGHKFKRCHGSSNA